MRPIFDCPLPRWATWTTKTPVPMAVYAKNDIVSHSLLNYGSWEGYLHSKFRRGAKMIDIGANIGYHSIMAAKHGMFVLAIEPMATNRRLLSATLCRNKELARRITVVSSAIDLFSASCRMYSDSINEGDGHLRCGTEPKPADTSSSKYVLRERVPVQPLKDILQTWRPGPYYLIKIDVEGSECKVLQSAPTSLKPRWLIAETTFPGSARCVRDFAAAHSCSTESHGADTVIDCATAQ